MSRILRFAISALVLALAACSHQEDAKLLMLKSEDLSRYESVLVAHKGSWYGTGCPENSIESILCSRQIGFRNVEIDLRITADSVIVLSHDAKINGFDLLSNDASCLNGAANKSGRDVAKFEEVLKLMLGDRELSLIAEIKDVNVGVLDRLVSQYGLKDRVLFIAFDCKYTDRMIAMGYHCGYLGGDMEPKWLKDKGYEFMDYNYNILLDKPEWIVQAKSLGLIVGAFTVDDFETIKLLATMGVNLITTNLTSQQQ